MSKDDLLASRKRRMAKNPAVAGMIQAATVRQDFGALLQKHREKLGLSQTQVAARMKTSATVVGRVELGADVQLSTLERYLEAIGLSLKLDVRTTRAQDSTLR